jgi:dTDP-4-amino-4,6-dideoxygalactose transaminase
VLTARPIPITSVTIGDAEEREVLEVLRSGRLVQGPKVEELERRFGELAGVRHAVAVSNGTIALEAALEALGVGEGDEVVTTPFTFVATVNAALHAGATVRFADIDASDFCMTAASAAQLVGPRTRALLPVHLYGHPADVDALGALAAAHDLRLVEDAAQAHGATVHGRHVGTADVGCFSLYATKNIAAGEGGLVTTNDDEVAARLRLLRNQGMRERYAYEVPGRNWRLSDLHAAVALPTLRTYDQVMERRDANARGLIERLTGVEGILLPSARDGVTHAWHQFTIRVDQSRIARADFVDAVRARGVGCEVYYPKLAGDYDCYREHPRVVLDDTPVARGVAAEVVSLPVHPGLDGTDLDQIADAVRDAMGQP